MSAVLEAERVTDAAEPLPAPPRRGRPSFGALPSLRKSMSCGQSLAALEGHTEVYVVQRPFLSFGANLFKRLPPALNAWILDVGVCHYMTCFRLPSGAIVQFDFGPAGGGDISLGPAERGRAARLFSRRRSRAVPAEIREAKLASLPESYFFAGRTSLSLQQIRAFNEAQRLEYEVHRTDCRHYVDRLVQYSTGLERAAAATARHAFESRQTRLRWAAGLTACTDAAHYGRLTAGLQASLGALALLSNRAKLSRALSCRAAPSPGRALARVPAPAALPRRVLPTAGAATAGVAAAAWAEVPLLGHVISLGEGMKRAASRGISWMGGLACAAGGSLGAGRPPLLRLPLRARQPALSLT